MSNRLHLQAALLLAGALAIGGWALVKLLEPANLMSVLQLFSMC